MVVSRSMIKILDKMKQVASPDNKPDIIYSDADDMINGLKKELEKRKGKEKDPKKLAELDQRMEQFEHDVLENLTEEEKQHQIELSRNQLDDLFVRGKTEDILIQLKRGKRSIIEKAKEEA